MQQQLREVHDYSLSTLLVEDHASPNDILAQNPRYHELCDKYHEAHLDQQPKKARTDDTQRVDPDSLAARLIHVLFVLDDNLKEMVVSAASTQCNLDKKSPNGSSTEASDTVNTSVEFKLPKTMNIYATMGHVARHFRISPIRLRLVWETGQRENPNDSGDHQALNSDTDSDSGPEGASERADGQPMPNLLSFREEPLLPPTRLLETWFNEVQGTAEQNRSVRIRVEHCESLGRR